MKKEKAPTLADRVYMSTLDKHPPHWFRGAQQLRSLMHSARRFKLDDQMAAFLNDLATAAFVSKRGFKLRYVGLADSESPVTLLDSTRGIGGKNRKLVEQIRISARLPHATTWIEYNLKALRRRYCEMVGIEFKDDCPDEEGWLLVQHPTIETAFTAHLFNYDHDWRNDTALSVFPCVYHWRTDDEPLPFQPMLEGLLSPSWLSELIVGLANYRTKQVNVGASPFCKPTWKSTVEGEKRVTNLIVEWSGVVRRMWALLASINDIPFLATEVRPTHGFFKGGQYKRFLDHKIITLRIPGDKDMRVIARKVMAAARRRAHMVRGHWRKDWRNPLHPLCEHEWNPETNVCKLCQGHRMWITEHQRGDAGLGFVTHDYSVEHKEPRPSTMG